MSDLVINQKNRMKDFLLSRKGGDWLFVFLFSIGVILNLWYAAQPPTFLHPDEVYQTLEIAHKIVYGYGIVAWEWQVGSFVTPSNPAGYGPIRSLITPLIFAIFFVIGDGLHLNYWNQTLPLIRIILYINFLIGLVLASKILKELDPDKTSNSWKIFLIITLFYYEFILYGSKTETNTMILPIMCFPLLIWIKSDIDNRKDNWALEGIGGFLVGVSIWLRPDSGIVMAFFVLLYLEHLRIRKIFTFGIGFVLSALLNGLLDLLYYGKFFVSFPNFLKFNGENQSYFGVSRFGWYFDTVILGRQSYTYLLILIISTIIAFMLISLYRSNYKKNFKIDSLFTKKFILLIKLSLWSFLVLFWWETQPHKEERFVIAWEITYVILGAYVLSIIAKSVSNYIHDNSLKLENLFKKSNIHIPSKYFKFNLYFLILIIICTPFFVNDLSEANRQPWRNFNDVLESFVWIGQQKNVTGVAIVISLWYSGGYSYLHRNVPLYHLDPPFINSSGHIFIPKILAINHLINYLVIPKYQYSWYPDLYNATVTTGFTLVKVIFGTCDIWYY